MKLPALLAILLLIGGFVAPVNAQRSGGVMIAPRGGVAVRNGPVGVYGGTHFAPSIGARPAPGTMFIPAPQIPGRAFAPVIVPPIAPQPHFHGTHWQHPAAIVHPGIVIIDVPSYNDGTVITQIAPGVIQQERRHNEPSITDARTRVGGPLPPFDPAPRDIVERMLTLASVKPGDLLYDLGAGDGRIVIAAAKKFGIRAVGYESDAGLVKLARENVKKQGVERLVEIRQQDFLEVNLAPASVITLYLSADGNLALRSKLMNQLRPGARVVSYTFDMAEWQAKVTEKYRDDSGNIHMLYLWQIGEPLAFR